MHSVKKDILISHVGSINTEIFGDLANKIKKKKKKKKSQSATLISQNRMSFLPISLCHTQIGP